jgi:hypothetical protein
MRSARTAGPYERLVGRIFFAFDPANPHDRQIVDLDRAPRNGAGEVEAWSEFVMLVPRDAARRSAFSCPKTVPWHASGWRAVGTG